jgi:STE24 endopeptidase
MLAPVFVDPLFNDYKPLRAGPVREAVLSLARANQIPTDNVVGVRSLRVRPRASAPTSPASSAPRAWRSTTTCSKRLAAEVKAVMGHEMGHYVLNHGLRLTVYLSLVIAFGFWFVHRLFDARLARWGGRWGLEGRTDPAALPLALTILSVFFLFATPLTNSIVRQAEAEADAFGPRRRARAARFRHGSNASEHLPQDRAGSLGGRGRSRVF